VVHFGHEGAIAALTELRRIKDKGAPPPQQHQQPAPAAAPVTPAKGDVPPAHRNLISLEEAQRHMKGSIDPMSSPNYYSTATTALPDSPAKDKNEREKARMISLGAQDAAAAPKELTPEERKEAEAVFLEDAQYDFVEGMKDAIEKGVDIDCKDQHGDSALIIACTYGSVNAATLLLKIRCSKNHKNARGETALYRACVSNNVDIIRLLLKSKVKLDSTDSEGRTALMITAMLGFEDATGELLIQGVNVNHFDKTMKTALLLAAYQGHATVCGYLLDCHANIDFCDQFGWTALMMAAYNNHVDTVRVLLERGASTTTLTTRGRTVMDLAEEANATDVLAELRAAQAVTTIKRRKKATSSTPKDEAPPPKEPKAKEKKTTKEKEKKAPKNTELPESVTDWDEDDVGNWLMTLGSEFGQYVPFFKENNITGKRLMRLTEEKVKLLGVSSMGHRDDIVAEIEDLKKSA